MPFPAIAMAAVKYGPAIYGMLRSVFGDHGGNVNWNEVERWLAGQHAEGSLSTQDNLAADATRSRLVAGAEDTARGQNYALATRLRQRVLLKKLRWIA